jgi:phosphonate transport system substrate-binding protein
MLYKFICFLSFFVFISACSSSPSPTGNATANNQSGGKIVVALKPDKNPDQMLEERGALAKYLSDALKRPVEVVIPLSSAVIIEGFNNGSIDMGYLSATDTVNAKNAAEILLVGEIGGKTTYQSYWVSLKDKPYARVEDLRGKPIAFASKTSTSGFLIPFWDLRKKGLANENPEEFFGAGNVWYGSGYVSAIERVLNGDAEAAAVSYYVLDEDKHLTAEQRGRLKKVAEQGDVPTHIIAVRSTLSAADKKALKDALLAMNQGGNENLRDKVFTSKLVETDAERHLAPIREALSVAPKL